MDQETERYQEIPIADQFPDLAPVILIKGLQDVHGGGILRKKARPGIKGRIIKILFDPDELIVFGDTIGS